MTPIRLLLVDDSDDLRFLVRAAVESRGGFEIAGEASDGSAAVDAARELQPDLVLLDLDMPRMNGLEALPLVREAAPGAAVVVLSSFRREQYERDVRAAGAVGYLQKGLSARQLVDELLALAGVIEVVDGVLSTVQRGLPATTASAGEARRFVDQVLSQWDCGAVLDDVQLLVTELVTNAIIHAGSDAQVAVRLLPDALRIEVVDRGPVQQLTAGAPDRSDAESGRGLYLVERVAAAWGVDPIEQGKAVWFEVRRPDSPRVE